MIVAVVMGSVGTLLGGVLGSFLATLILRWPEGRTLSGRSCCDACGRTLRVWELVPILSYLAQKGRCRSCGASIARGHLWVELGCAVIGAVAALYVPFPAALGWAVLGWALLTLALLDARHFWLPDAITLPLAALGLMVSVWVTGVSLGDALIGAGVGYGSLLAIAVGYRALRGREGLGLGDAKLLGALGAWFGWQALPQIVLCAAVMGLAWALVQAIATRRWIDGGVALPLGTFLCLAALPGAWMSQALSSGL